MSFTNGKTNAHFITDKNGEMHFQKPKLICKDESRTIQSAKDECDVNKIVERFTKTGLLTHVNVSEPRYGDFSEVADYQTALMEIMKAEDSFSRLPSSVRKMFDNDPQKVIDFVQDDKNYEKAIKLGLIDKEKGQEYLEKKDKLVHEAERKKKAELAKAIKDVQKKDEKQ